MTSPFPTSEDALKECLHLLLNTQKDGCPPSSPRGNRPPPPSARKRREGVAPPRVLWAPSPRLPLPLKATRRKDGRRGWLWAATIGMVGAAARRSPRSGPRTEPPTGASFPPHSPRAQRTMAPVGPRRSASARRPGLQLPGTPAARCAPPSGRRPSWPANSGRQAKPRRGRAPSASRWAGGGLGRGKSGRWATAPGWATTQAGRDPHAATRAANAWDRPEVDKGKLGRGRAGSAEGRGELLLTPNVGGGEAGRKCGGAGLKSCQVLGRGRC